MAVRPGTRHTDACFGLWVMMLLMAQLSRALGEPTHRCGRLQVITRLRKSSSLQDLGEM